MRRMRRQSRRRPLRKRKDPDILRLENDLQQKLGASVVVHHANGKGSLTISYNSLDELEGILERIG